MTDSVSLSLRGDVERPARLAVAELRSLMDTELVADFHCREGWSRPGERWRGVRLATLLALAGAAGTAGYVTAGSGDYTAVLTREQAGDERVLLALEHEGAASPPARRLPPAGRALRVGLLSERQIGGPDRGDARASAGDRGDDRPRPAQPLSGHYGWTRWAAADGTASRKPGSVQPRPAKAPRMRDRTSPAAASGTRAITEPPKPPPTIRAPNAPAATA
jgi:hypothetical protein